MQKTARVAPRNIQFKDNVQIKEIPSRDLEPEESARRESWDPNLTDKEIFKENSTQQRNCIIGFIICGAVLLCAIIGIVLGVVLSQKTPTAADQSLSYNAMCTAGSNQCKSSQGLSCPHGFCVCSSPYSWNPLTTSCTLLTYNQACSTSNQCNSSLGLYCISQICQCDPYNSWNASNNTCTIIPNNTLNYGAKCANGSMQCNSAFDLGCTGNCTCQNGKVWNVTNCVCPAATFLNSSNICQTAFRNNVSCTVGSNQCDSTRNLSCNVNTSLCQCDPNKYWNLNFETCLFRVNYSLSCTYDSDCVPTLICPTVPGVCNCSLFLPDYVCNCANDKYYDPITVQCLNRSTFNGPCLSTANYTCLTSLYCNAGLCACPLGTTWIAANSTCA